MQLKISPWTHFTDVSPTIKYPIIFQGNDKLSYVASEATGTYCDEYDSTRQEWQRNGTKNASMVYPSKWIFYKNKKYFTVGKVSIPGSETTSSRSYFSVTTLKNDFSYEAITYFSTEYIDAGSIISANINLDTLRVFYSVSGKLGIESRLTTYSISANGLLNSVDPYRTSPTSSFYSPSISMHIDGKFISNDNSDPTSF